MAAISPACGCLIVLTVAGVPRAGKSGSSVRPFRSFVPSSLPCSVPVGRVVFSLSVRLSRSSLIAFLSVPAPCPMGRASSVSGLGPAAVAGAGSRWVRQVAPVARVPLYGRRAVARRCRLSISTSARVALAEHLCGPVPVVSDASPPRSLPLALALAFVVSRVQGSALQAVLSLSAGLPVTALAVVPVWFSGWLWRMA